MSPGLTTQRFTKVSRTVTPWKAYGFRNVTLTQFHPEASAETLGASWAVAAPELCDAYHDGDAGNRPIENFFDIVRRNPRQK